MAKELTLQLTFKSESLTHQDLEEIRKNITDHIFQEMKDYFIENYFSEEERNKFLNKLDDDNGGGILDVWFYTEIPKEILDKICENKVIISNG